MLDKHRSAIDEYQKTLAITPISPDVHFHLGQSYTSLNMHNEAVKAYHDTLRLSPNYFEAYIGIGKAYINSGKNNEAIPPLRNAIGINPSSLEASDQAYRSYRFAAGGCISIVACQVVLYRNLL